MVLKVFQKGFNYSQDGQGNRLVYHLQGCNMKCPWCANPEGMPMDGVIFTDQAWLRDGLCPRGAVKDGKLDRSVCAACKERTCLEARHRSKGIRLSCEERTVDEVYEEIVGSSPMFYDGGGVTFTGGECTMQFEPLRELLIRLKEAGIHTAIETNGSHPRLPELFPYIDQLIMDCKHWDAEAHKKYTGVPIEVVEQNLREACRTHPRVDIRIPLIGGVNDGERDMEGFTAFLEEISGNNVTAELLKYHEFGRNKWEECGLEYAMTEKAHVTVDQMKRLKEMLTEHGIHYKKS